MMFGEGYSGSSGNQVVFHDSDGQSLWHDCISSTNLSPNRWYHIGVTDDGGTMKIYIDGKVDRLCDQGYGIPSEIICPIRIGKIDYRSYFNGLIDDIRIYDVPLTPQEVQQLYNETLRE